MIFRSCVGLGIERGSEDPQELSLGLGSCVLGSLGRYAPRFQVAGSSAWRPNRKNLSSHNGPLVASAASKAAASRLQGRSNQKPHS